MQEHLSDEQLTSYLLGGDDAATRGHLASCPACGEEEESMRRALALYRESLRAAAERPAGFRQAQQPGLATLMARRRLAWAGAVAILFIVAVLLTEKTPPGSATREDSDQVLLVEVEHSVRRELPRALEPAALLAQEISQSEQAQPNP